MLLQPIQSLDCGLGPLSSADWSPKNSLLIVAAIRYSNAHGICSQEPPLLQRVLLYTDTAMRIRSEVYVWDLSRPPSPVGRRTLHEEGVRAVTVAGAAEAVVATNGQPNYGVKVSRVTFKVMML